MKRFCAFLIALTPMAANASEDNWAFADLLGASVLMASDTVGTLVCKERNAQTGALFACTRDNGIRLRFLAANCGIIPHIKGKFSVVRVQFDGGYDEEHAFFVPDGGHEMQLSAEPALRFVELMAQHNRLYLQADARHADQATWEFDLRGANEGLQRMMEVCGD